MTYTGSWSLNRLAGHSGGTARLSMSTGARAKFVFSGTGVRWVGYRDEWSGIATVSVDGVAKGTVDTYATPGRARATQYRILGLSNGKHTLTIKVTGTRRSASGGSWIWVDAFDVYR